MRRRRDQVEDVARASRTAVNPSVPCTWGKQRMKPAASGAMGKSAGRSTCQPAWLSRNAPTTPSFSSGSSEHVAYTSRPPGLTSDAAAARMPALLFRQPQEIVFRAPPLHLGISPEDAQVGARRVHEDAIAAHLPVRREGRDRPCMALDDGDAEPRGRLAEQLEPARVRVHRQDLPAITHELGQVGRLGSGRRAGIRHDLSGQRSEQPGDQHGRLVLNGAPALGECRPLGRRRREARRALRARARSAASRPALHHAPDGRGPRARRAAG